MATVSKDFRVKNGLVVEGSTATVNGSTVLTEGSTEFIQDTIAGVFDTSHTGVTFTYNDSTGKLVANVDTTPTFASSIIFEGSTADAYETTLQVTDPASDITLTLPNSSGTIALTSDIPTLDTDDVSEGSTNLYFTDDRAQDAVAQALANGTHTNITVSYNDSSNAISLTGAVTYTDENAQDAIGNALGSGLSYNDSTGAISVDTSTIQARVADVSDTEIGYLNGVTSAIQTQIDSKFASADASTTNISEGTNLYFTDERAQDAIGNNVGNGLDYDDSSGAISVDPSEFALSAVGAPTGNVAMATYKITGLGTPTDSTDAVTKAYVDSATEGLHIHESVVAATTANVNLANALENGDVLDGITLATGNRILVKNQTTQSENGIYVVQASGQPVRATDFDTATEVDSGDFVFVYSGTANASTGWVQTNRPAIIGTDAIVFTQFSGAGTYLAGNGLSLNGTTFSIDTTITTDLSTSQTLTNKTISGSSNTLSNIANSSLTNSEITINGTSVSLGGTRTLGSDDISEGSTNKYFTDERAQDAVGNAVGTGLAYNDSTGAISNAGVTELTGTSDQVTVSASTGSVTLSLPQSIATTSSVTFSGVTAGSVTLADALVGTALATASTSATTIDTWSATTYSSAKYLVQMKKGSDIEVIELLVTVDGNNNVYLTEYADVISNAELGTTNAVYSGGNVLLQVTGASADTSVKVHKVYIEA